MGRPSLKSLHGSPDMHSPRVPDRQRIASRRDRALKRSSVVIAKKRLGRPPSVSRHVESVDMGARKKEGDADVDVGASGESGNVGKSVDSDKEEEEDLEVSFKKPNEGGDCWRGDEEVVVVANGEMASNKTDGSEAGDDEVTQIEPVEGVDMNSDTDIEDNAEVDQSNAEKCVEEKDIEENAEVDQSNADKCVEENYIEENSEVDQSNKCVEEEDNIECTFTDDVNVVVEEVVECTMNIDPSDGIELVETTVPSEDVCIPVNDQESNICDSPKESGSGEHREASPYLFDAIKANKLLSTDNATQDVVANSDSDVPLVTETVAIDDSEVPTQVSGASCEAEVTDDSTEEEAVPLCDEQVLIMSCLFRLTDLRGGRRRPLVVIFRNLCSFV